ncbi:MAG: prmC 1 [Phycisphaerales bacterium]|nr:prmC 1 [Phycisphaerales bacterium]
MPDAPPAPPPAAVPALPPGRTDPAYRRDRARLLARIHRQYETATEPRRVGSIDLPFTRIKDPDRVLDQVVEECDRAERLTGVRLEDPQHLPYWAELWDSAAGVGQVMLEEWGRAGVSENRGVGAKRGESKTDSATPPPRHSDTPTLRYPSPRILDLGCGMGLTGTIAAALGGRVLLADIETPALLFARLNSLPWNVPIGDGLGGHRPRVRARRVNWQADDLGERFDLIVGADILYERKQWEFLDAFWRRHLAPGGHLLLGEPGRMTGDTFLDWAPARGWHLERRDLKVVTRETPVRVLRLTLQ